MDNSETNSETPDRFLEQIMEKSDMFDYLEWLQIQYQNDEPGEFFCLAEDGKDFWGETYSDAVRAAMSYDKSRLGD